MLPYHLPTAPDPDRMARRGPSWLEERLRMAPSAALLVGALLLLVGYLMPWFRLGGSYRWWLSGSGIMTSHDGPGWTIVPLLLFAVAAAVALWAHVNVLLAQCAIVASVSGAGMAAFVVGTVLHPAADIGVDVPFTMPIGAGIPLMALGLAVTLAGIATAGVTTDRTPATRR